MLTSGERRALLAESHPLKPVMTVEGPPIREEQLERLRGLLASGGLIKVKLATENRDHSDALAAALAKGVPCELVRRIGKVAVFYASSEPSANSPTD